MTWHNDTVFNEFVLLGFSNLGRLQILLFFVFLCIFMITVTGNFLIILLTRIDASLQSPMYFFLRNLSFAEIGIVSSITPKVLLNLLSEKKTISLFGCKTQMYFFFLFLCAECSLFIVMAYDRVVAICNPLRYAVIMNSRLCALLATVIWTAGIPYSIINPTWLFSFPFCKSNEISHFFCDAPPIFQLTCGDTYKVELYSFIGTFMGTVVPFALIVLSYIRIIMTICRIPSTEGRWNAFSTCSSHITAVTLFYGSTGIRYMRPTSNSSSGNNYMLSVPYVFITPMLNPIIYSLRNKEVKGAFYRLLARKIY